MKSFDESLENLASEWVKPTRSSARSKASAAETASRAGETLAPKTSSSPGNERKSVSPRDDAKDVHEPAAKPEAAPELGSTSKFRQTEASESLPSEVEKPPENDGSRPSTPEVSDQGPVDPHLVCLLDPRAEHAESYYRLRYVLETRRVPESALVVGVTSPSQGDGKTLTGINLAGALAKDTGARVLLLDLDLRRQGEGMPDYLGMNLERNLGIVDWIREAGYGHEQFTHYLHRFNLHVMAAGSDPELPYELLKSPRLDDLIRHARAQYDFVIIDTPQILRLPDTELISRLVDGFLIVVKADQTRHGELEEALNLMTESKVLGLVFNAVTENR